MARSRATATENSFIRGLVTEATGLNFPENACTDTDNCRFDKVGRVSRRGEFDLEDSHNASPSKTVEEGVFAEYIWQNAGEEGNSAFVVAQSGQTLYFYIIGQNNNVSIGEKSFEVDLESYKVSGAPDTADELCSFDEGRGFLFVAHPYLDPLYVSYSASSDSLTVNQIELEIRDFSGLEDSLESDERPSTLSVEHKYNLYNQGWRAKWDTSGPYVLDRWSSLISSEYPSNSDIWWLMKDSSDDFRPDKKKNTIHVGKSEAPQGHFILKAFYKDFSDVSGITGLSVKSSSYYRPSQIAFFAGRVWYAGVDYSGYSGNVYFSQIIVEDEGKFGKCYQRYDPTAEDLSDLLDNDGGLITVPEIGKIHNLFPAGNSLVIFASNGVWAITGSDNSGFKATDFSVNKVSALPSVSPASFVDTEGTPIWWNFDGIYTVVPDELKTGFKATSLTDDTIRDFFLEIPEISRKTAKGTYNSLTNEIYWLYRSTEPTTVSEQYEYDRILVFNVKTKAFYPWSFSGTPKLKGLFTIKSQGTVFEDFNVIDSSANNVVDSSSNQVIAEFSEANFSGTKTKFFVDLVGTLSVVDEKIYDGTFTDWYSLGTGQQYETNYSSYFVTGFRIRGEGQRKWQSNYITVFSEESDDTTVKASCMMKTSWDWSNSSDTNRYSNLQEVCRNRKNYLYHSRKLKIRGHGKSMRMHFESVDGKPFVIVGWTSWDSANATP